MAFENDHSAGNNEVLIFDYVPNGPQGFGIPNQQSAPRGRHRGSSRDYTWGPEQEPEIKNVNWETIFSNQEVPPQILRRVTMLESKMAQQFHLINIKLSQLAASIPVNGPPAHLGDAGVPYTEDIASILNIAADNEDISVRCINLAREGIESDNISLITASARVLAQSMGRDAIPIIETLLSKIESSSAAATLRAALRVAKY